MSRRREVIAKPPSGCHHPYFRGDVDEDEDVAKARRLMRTTQSYEDVEFPATSLKGNEHEQPPPPRSAAAAIVLLRPRAGNPP